MIVRTLAAYTVATIGVAILVLILSEKANPTNERDGFRYLVQHLDKPPKHTR